MKQTGSDPRIVLRWNDFTSQDDPQIYRMVFVPNGKPSVVIERKRRNAIGEWVWASDGDLTQPFRMLQAIGQSLFTESVFADEYSTANLPKAAEDAETPSKSPQTPGPLDVGLTDTDKLTAVRAWAKHTLDFADIGNENLTMEAMAMEENRETVEHYRSAYVLCANAVLALIGTDP